MSTVHEAARDVPVVAETDVLVVGGGPAGVMAAVAAAREGRKVILAERYGCLGGMATDGLVMAWPGWDEDGGADIFGGLGLDLYRRMQKRGDITYGPHGNSTSAHFDPELMKVVMIEMCEEQNVTIRHHVWAVNASVADNSVDAVVFESKQGRHAVCARCTVDATGDADIAHFAGAETVAGHMHQMGLRDISMDILIGNVDKERAIAAGQDPSSPYEDFIDRFNEQYGQKMWFKPLPMPGTMWSMSIDFFEADCLKVEDLTRVEIEGRKIADAFVAMCRKEIPGMEEAFLMKTASQIAVRASRQIVGEVTITKQDALDLRPWEDTIGQGDHCSRRIGFEIPYRALVPKSLDGLLASGRCISAETPEGMHKIRPIPACLVTGEAAGAAAALAVEKGTTPRDVPVGQLQERLADHGVYLKAKQTGKTISVDLNVTHDASTQTGL